MRPCGLQRAGHLATWPQGLKKVQSISSQELYKIRYEPKTEKADGSISRSSAVEKHKQVNISYDEKQQRAEPLSMTI